MATLVLVEDKVAGSKQAKKYQLELPSERLTVRELITLFVADQVDRFNETPVDRSSRHQSEEERILNPLRPTKHTQRRDCEAECQRALVAFGANSIFLLIDGNQVSDLDEVITIKPSTSVSFLRLVPLVGG
jgi:hypothetical protein